MEPRQDENRVDWSYREKERIQWKQNRPPKTTWYLRPAWKATSAESSSWHLPFPQSLPMALWLPVWWHLALGRSAVARKEAKKQMSPQESSAPHEKGRFHIQHSPSHQTMFHSSPSQALPKQTCWKRNGGKNMETSETQPMKLQKPRRQKVTKDTHTASALMFGEICAPSQSDVQGACRIHPSEINLLIHHQPGSGKALRRMDSATKLAPVWMNHCSRRKHDGAPCKMSWHIDLTPMSTAPQWPETLTPVGMARGSGCGDRMLQRSMSPERREAQKKASSPNCFQADMPLIEKKQTRGSIMRRCPCGCHEFLSRLRRQSVLWAQLPFPPSAVNVYDFVSAGWALANPCHYGTQSRSCMHKYCQANENQTSFHQQVCASQSNKNNFKE